MDNSVTGAHPLYLCASTRSADIQSFTSFCKAIGASEWSDAVSLLPLLKITLRGTIFKILVHYNERLLLAHFGYCTLVCLHTARTAQLRRRARQLSQPPAVTSRPGSHQTIGWLWTAAISLQYGEPISSSRALVTSASLHFVVYAHAYVFTACIPEGFGTGCLQVIRCSLTASSRVQSSRPHICLACMQPVRRDDPTLPPPWQCLFEPAQNATYYWNPNTNVTQYERPAGGPPAAAAPPVPSRDAYASQVRRAQA
jgi:WW domain